MFKRLTVLIVLLGIAIAGCDSQRIYEKNIDFDDIVWNIDSVQVFEFEITETHYYYNLYFNLRTLVAYPFQNIYVGYWLETKDGKVLLTNTENANNLLDLQIFDPKSGKPLGDGLGDLFDQQQSIVKDFQFETAGTYRLKFKHYMRVDQLPGIVSIGARVETAVVED